MLPDPCTRIDNPPQKIHHQQFYTEKKSENFFYLRKLPVKSVSWGTEVFTVAEIVLPLLTKQVFTITQMSGMCWNLWDWIGLCQGHMHIQIREGAAVPN